MPKLNCAKPIVLRSLTLTAALETSNLASLLAVRSQRQWARSVQHGQHDGMTLAC